MPCSSCFRVADRSLTLGRRLKLYCINLGVFLKKCIYFLVVIGTRMDCFFRDFYFFILIAQVINSTRPVPFFVLLRSLCMLSTGNRKSIKSIDGAAYVSGAGGAPKCEAPSSRVFAPPPRWHACLCRGSGCLHCAPSICLGRSCRPSATQNLRDAFTFFRPVSRDTALYKSLVNVFFSG